MALPKDKGVWLLVRPITYTGIWPKRQTRSTHSQVSPVTSQMSFSLFSKQKVTWVPVFILVMGARIRIPLNCTISTSTSSCLIQHTTQPSVSRNNKPIHHNTPGDGLRVLYLRNNYQLASLCIYRLHQSSHSNITNGNAPNVTNPINGCDLLIGHGEENVGLRLGTTLRSDLQNGGTERMSEIEDDAEQIWQTISFT